MLTRIACAIFGIGIGLATAPVHAADDIEAKAQVCAACHGNKGTPTDPKTMPIIWGQQESYLMKQLRDFRNGERQSAIMAPLAKGLAEEDLRPLAAHFAAKPWPSKKAQAKPPAPPKGVAQCQACHQPIFEGGMPAPRLAGLSSEYLAQEMREFANGERHNNLDMPGFMRALTEAERSAIARYLSAL
ncbi:MAG TPA: c-type cytochrome [Burkholderiales bacterium]|jgi:cytochrome c553